MEVFTDCSLLFTFLFWRSPAHLVFFAIKNEEYINILNNIAIGKNLKQCVSYINTNVEIRNFAKLLYEQTGAVYLTAYRNEVYAINEYHVAQHKLTDSMYTELEYKENKQVICKFRLIWPRIPLRADQSFRM